MYYDSQVLFMAVELKYCERCGELYLRRSGSRTNLCTSCVAAERALGFGPKKASEPVLAGSNWRCGQPEVACGPEMVEGGAA